MGINFIIINSNSTEESGAYNRGKTAYFAVALPVDKESELVDTNEAVELVNSRLLHTRTYANALSDSHHPPITSI